YDLYFYRATHSTELSTLSLHDALPIYLVDRLQLVERVHRLHRDGQADAALDTPFESVQRARLGAHRAVVPAPEEADEAETRLVRDRKSTRLNSSHLGISYAVFCLQKKK